MQKFTVALLYNSKQNAPHVEGEPWDAWNELDSEKTAGQIERALRAGGHEVIAMEGDVTLAQKLAHYKVDIGFNICEGHHGSSREAQVPAILDMLQMPYTGAGVMTLAVALDKPMSKRVMAYYGLPTPPFQTFFTAEDAIDSRLKYPLFAKPCREGSGIGISAKSVCRNARELREQVRFLIKAYRQPALVEEFVDGREFTLGLVGNLEWNATAPNGNGDERELVVAGAADNGGRKTRLPAGGNGRSKKLLPASVSTLRVFPPLEVDLSPCPADQAGLYTSVIKSQMYDVPKYLCPAPTTKALRTKLERLAVNAFAALECRDFARVDFRLSADTGQPMILEINPLAGLQERISDIVMGAEAAGIDYVTLVNSILEAALRRYGLI